MEQTTLIERIVTRVPTQPPTRTPTQPPTQVPAHTQTSTLQNAAPAESIVPASVNGVPLTAPGETCSAEDLRQRACVELLRQKAIALGLLAPEPAASAGAPARGAISEAASAAIDTLLDGFVTPPLPDEDSCRRYFAANAARFAIGERVHARHVLFAVTRDVDVARLRQRAEACLLDLRVKYKDTPEAFATAARELSNCPSAAEGGDLGWLSAEDCAPEFAAALFGAGQATGNSQVGVLAQLVHSRFGFHVVAVDVREPGATPDYESVRTAVSGQLQRQAFTTALRRYVQQLAEEANLEGVVLNGD